MIHINKKTLRRREMKLITRSKGKERDLHDVSVIKHKHREMGGAIFLKLQTCHGLECDGGAEFAGRPACAHMCEER